jgi:hypothetical protein
MVPADDDMPTLPIIATMPKLPYLAPVRAGGVGYESGPLGENWVWTPVTHVIVGTDEETGNADPATVAATAYDPDASCDPMTGVSDATTSEVLAGKVPEWGWALAFSTVQV